MAINRVINGSGSHFISLYKGLKTDPQCFLNLKNSRSIPREAIGAILKGTLALLSTYFLYSANHPRNPNTGELPFFEGYFCETIEYCVL